MIGSRAGASPDAPAIRYEKDGLIRTDSYAQFSLAVSRRAAELRQSKKTCLGLLADGSRECVIELFAAVQAGMQLVLLDQNTPALTLRGLIPYTDIDMLWGDPELCMELEPFLTEGVKDGAGRVLFFTSGTTERAKAVVLTEESLCSSAFNGGALLPLSGHDVLLSILPLGHVFGFVCGLLWGLSCGACVALGRGPRHYIDDLAVFRPTAVSVVPLLLGFLVKHGLLNSDLKLVLIGAGDCPGDLINAVKAQGIRVSFGYGLTETSSGVALSLGDDPFAMTICPDDRISLADDGEILIEVPSCMMQGYYKDAESTEKVLSGGILHTGDLGRFDEEGHLFITGRKKDMLVLADGTKLFLPEAEAQLAGLLGAADFALVLKDGGVSLAISGYPHTDSYIRDMIRPYQEERPRGQQIHDIIRLDAPLPRTATGKIKRWELQNKL